MENYLKPEKTYSNLLKFGLIIGVIIGIIAIFVIIFYPKELFIGKNFLVILILILFIIGSFIRYQIIMKVPGMPGQVINSKNQKNIKQMIYIVIPLILIACIYLNQQIIQRYSLIYFIILLSIILITWFLFLKRLKNLEKQEGKDNSSIIKSKEMIIIAIIIIFLIFFFIWFASNLN